MPSGYSAKRSNRARAIVKATLPAPCFRCGGIVTEDMRWHADHTTPRAFAEAAGLSEADIDSPSSLAASHASCNMKANARPNQTKAQRVQSRIQRVERPQFENILENSEVFSDNDQSPNLCSTKTLPECGSEVTE